MRLEKSGDRLRDKLIKGAVELGGGPLMVWGYMIWDRVEYASKIDDRKDRTFTFRF